jgi:uncharacterized phage protein gp47/JayE
MSYGLTPAGFVPKTFAVVRDEINARLKSEFGVSLDVGDLSTLGQLVAIFAEREALLWELIEAIVSSQDPDAATDTLLDALAVLTGTTRRPADSSVVVLTLTGTPTTVVSSGSKASVVVAGEVFATAEEATIAATAAWSSGTPYDDGDRVTNASRVYQCIAAGTSAGSGGPTTTDASIADGSVTWRYLGEGTGDVDVIAVADETGPIAGVSGSITVIETPVSGWDSVINVLDAELGADVETDEALRVRREVELADAGSTTADAIRSALMAVADVIAVHLFVNDSDSPVAFEDETVPGHTIEALVHGGADQDIWDTLLANVAAGIGTVGSETGTAEDLEGNAVSVSFTRPQVVPVWVDVELTYDAAKFPADGDDQIKLAIATWGSKRTIGDDIVASAISAACFAVPGVLDVTLVEVGTADPPTASTTIAMTLRMLATYDTSRITVVSTPGTP